MSQGIDAGHGIEARIAIEAVLRVLAAAWIQGAGLRVAVGLVLLVEQIRKRRRQRLLALEIMVKGALGCARGLYDVVHRRPVVPLLIKQFPGGRNDLSFCVILRSFQSFFFRLLFSL